MADFAEPAQGGKRNDEPEMDLRARVGFLALAWAAALMLTLLVVFPHPVGAIFLPFFAEGLFFFLPEELALVIGWATYVTLTIFLLRSRTPARYMVLFLVLCALLAVNIPGCTHITDNRRLPHTI